MEGGEWVIHPTGQQLPPSKTLETRINILHWAGWEHWPQAACWDTASSPGCPQCWDRESKVTGR